MSIHVYVYILIWKVLGVVCDSKVTLMSFLLSVKIPVFFFSQPPPVRGLSLDLGPLWRLYFTVNFTLNFQLLPQSTLPFLQDMIPVFPISRSVEVPWLSYWLRLQRYPTPPYLHPLSSYAPVSHSPSTPRTVVLSTYKYSVRLLRVNLRLSVHLGNYPK